jgi:hypothetical protein
MMAATIGTGAASTPIRLRNLSIGGALIEGSDLPPLGETVLFKRGGRLVPSEIIWAAGALGGLRFTRPVEPREEFRRVSSPKPSKGVEARRPGLRCKPLSNREKQVLENWVALGRTALGD